MNLQTGEPVEPVDAVDRIRSARRWSRWVYLLVWLLIAAPQTMLLSTAMPVALSVGWTDPSALPYLVGAALLQVLKAAVSVPRLRDQGRPADDVVMAFVPLLNMALFFQLAFRGTPAEELRVRRIRSWATQVGAFEAYLSGARLMGRTWVVGVPTFAVAALVVGGGQPLWVGWLKGLLGGDARPVVLQGCIVLLVLAGLYTLLQLRKRRRVTLASWLPTLFVVPLAFVVIALLLADQAATGLGAGLLALLEAAWGLSVGGLVYGLAVLLAVVAADGVLQGRSASLTDVLAQARPRFAATGVAWTARWQLVQIGGQAIIPGVWFGITYAFADLVAALRPDLPPFATSSTLTRGIRSKIGKMLVLWFMADLVVKVAAWSLFVDTTLAFTALVYPSELPPEALIASSFAMLLVIWWTAMAMLVVFLEREELWRRKVARDAASHDAAASGDGVEDAAATADATS